jgi:hypothetical protein
MKVHFNLTIIFSFYMTCWFCQVNCIKLSVKYIKKQSYAHQKWKQLLNYNNILQFMFFLIKKIILGIVGT